MTMPVVVRDATSAAATFLVDAAAARRLLPGPELDVVELLPGRALFSIACIQYRDNDLGDYNEVSLAFFVRRRDEPRGVPVARRRGGAHAEPARDVDTGSCRSTRRSRAPPGRGIWGFPKTIEEITFSGVGRALVVPPRHGRAPRADDGHGARRERGRCPTRR